MMNQSVITKVTPAVLCFELEEQQLSAVQLLCAELGMAVREIRPEEYAESIGALCGLYQRFGNIYEGEPVPEEMVIFAGADSAVLQKLLVGFKKISCQRPALMACLTEANADWTVIELYRNLSRERDAIEEKMRQIHRNSAGHHHEKG